MSCIGCRPRFFGHFPDLRSCAGGNVSELPVYVFAGPHSILILGRFTRITQTGRPNRNVKVHQMDVFATPLPLDL